MTSATPIVFFDIAGPDFSEQAGFYSKVFNWDIDRDGKVSVPVHNSPTGLTGQIRTDPREAMLYMGVEDISEALAKVETHGGQTTVPRFEVPGTVILGLFTDPAGNRMGLVEISNGEPVVP